MGKALRVFRVRRDSKVLWELTDLTVPKAPKGIRGFPDRMVPMARKVYRAIKE